MLSYRNLGMIGRGEHLEHEASMVKIFSTEMMQRLQNAGLRLMRLHGQLSPEDERAPIGGRIEQGYRAAVMPTFGAGANEVMPQHHRDAGAGHATDLAGRLGGRRGPPCRGGRGGTSMGPTPPSVGDVGREDACPHSTESASWT